MLEQNLDRLKKQNKSIKFDNIQAHIKAENVKLEFLLVNQNKNIGSEYSFYQPYASVKRLIIPKQITSLTISIRVTIIQ